MAHDPGVALPQALEALYRNPDPDVRRAANRWLEDFQTSTAAWQVCDRFLHDASAPLEVQLFSAQTLRAKVEHDFDELPPGSAPSLRDSLLAALLRFSGGPPAVRTTLCAALAALAAHLPAADWGVPGGALPALAQRLAAEPPDRAVPCLLQLLIVLPQEVGSWRPAVHPERRRAYAAELLAATPTALSLLAQLVAAAGGNGGANAAAVPPAALEAYAAWVRLARGRDGSGARLPGAPTPPLSCDAAALATHPLTAAALDALASPELFDAAVEPVSELIRATSARTAATSASSPDPPAMDPAAAPLVSLLVPRVMALLPRFRAEAGAGGSGEDCRGMARLFAEVGETFLALIVTGAPEVLAPVEALLAVSGAADDDVAGVSYNFWSRLSEALTAKGANSGADSSTNATSATSAVSEEEQQRRRQLFAPALATLLRNVAGRVRLPDDYGARSRSARAEFKHNRDAVGTACLDAAAVLGGEAALGLLTQPLAALAAASASGAPFDWRTAEAALYCVRRVAAAAPPPDCALLAQLLSSLATLPPVPEVRYTACMTAAKYAPWAAAAAASGAPAAAELLPRLLALTASTLSDDAAAVSDSGDARAAAAHALAALCRAARGVRGGAGLLLPALPQLLQLYSRVAAEEDAADASLPPPPAGDATLPLHPEDVLELTAAVAVTASALGDPAELAGALQALLAPPLGVLAALLPPDADVAAGGPSAPPPPPPPPPPAGPTLRAFDRVAAACKELVGADEDGAGGNAAAADVVASAFVAALWPLAERALRRCGDEAAGERVCRCVRHVLRAAGAARCAPLLPPLAALLRPLFGARRHASLLRMASELCREFGPHAAAAPALTQLLCGLLCDATACLRDTGAVNAAPDVASETFLLAKRAVRLLPAAAFEANTLPMLLDAVVAATSAQQREAAEDCLRCCGALLRCREPAALPALSAALPPRGGALTRALLAAALSEAPLSRAADVAEALHALLALSGAAGRGWATAVLQSLPEAAAPAADVARCAAVLLAVADGAPQPLPTERQLSAALEELAQVCRRNRRAHDAAHAALTAPLQ